MVILNCYFELQLVMMPEFACMRYSLHSMYYCKAQLIGNGMATCQDGVCLTVDHI